VLNAIHAAGDTVVFGEIDFQNRLRDIGVDLRPTRLSLFGAPASGGKAMRNAPTLGLDASYQKFLIGEDALRVVHLSFHDLLSVAERQQVGKSISLRVIDFRLNRNFSNALNE